MYALLIMLASCLDYKSFSQKLFLNILVHDTSQKSLLGVGWVSGTYYSTQNNNNDIAVIKVAVAFCVIPCK